MLFSQKVVVKLLTTKTCCWCNLGIKCKESTQRLLLRDGRSVYDKSTDQNRGIIWYSEQSHESHTIDTGYQNASAV